MYHSEKVINLSNFRSRSFTQNDKRIIEEIRVGFAEGGMPHNITYGLTDEGEEWCLVSAHNHPDPVAEIRKCCGVYKHRGNWGYVEDRSLIEMFNKILPEGLKDTSGISTIRKGIKNG